VRFDCTWEINGFRAKRGLGLYLGLCKPVVRNFTWKESVSKSGVTRVVKHGLYTQEYSLLSKVKSMMFIALEFLLSISIQYYR
jgi:hypothetical protein